jgi:voltage-gated potassium channel
MASKEPSHASSLRIFLTFAKLIFKYCYVLRAVLGLLFVLVLLGGIGFAYVENIAIRQGIYFSLITSTTVGFGDITPKTIIGQCIAVYLALIGTILFGLVVAVATKAFTVTISEYSHAEKSSQSHSNE